MNLSVIIRRALCVLFAALGLAFFSAETADAVAVVKEVRHWSSNNYTRVVINLDRPSKFTHRLLQKDPSIKVDSRRLYIDIEGATLDKNLNRQIPINDGLLKTARAGQFDASTVRVVLDIESIEDFKIFPLTEPYRIVIDVTGAKSAQLKRPADEKEPVQTSAPIDVKKRDERPATGKAETPAGLIRSFVKTIVIDPGHGGKDPGAVGRNGLMEKDVTLRISKRLRERLASKLESKILMTRETDVFVPLEERTAIANSRDADLFVSVHINASPRRAATGIETYILNVSADAASRRLAARENATSAKSVSDLEFILNDLIKTAKTNDSGRLAAAVQEKLVSGLKARYTDIRGNGVKGAPFYVLVGTKMPSILVEVSFISNPMDEERLRDDAYIEEVVSGITAGLMQYINGAGSV